MDIKKYILSRIKQKGKIKSSEIVEVTGYSRVYVSRMLQQLRQEGKIALIGRTKKAYYVPVSEEQKAKRGVLELRVLEKAKGLSEHDVVKKIKRETGIFVDINDNVRRIIGYALSEMVNNAIEHSRSKEIAIEIKRSKDSILFLVRDWGVGIFNHIMKKKNLNSHLEAIQDLTKGKQTTAPKSHSGEGIFFTSKVADKLEITSSEKQLIFDNVISDVFVKTIKTTKGTRVRFTISSNSKRSLDSVFRKYTGDSLKFDKSKVAVKLFEAETEYLSRSQARRILVGLEKFETIILDFEGIETIGQAFADEIFRVWQNDNPDKKIIPQNANEDVSFMIQRALSST